MLKQLGLGFLNLVVVLVLVFGAQALLRGGHVKSSTALPILAAIVLVAYLAGSRWIERRAPPELSDFGGIVEVAAGLALGVALFSSVMGVLWALGAYHPTGRGVVAGLGQGASLALMAAVFEETVMRAFLFRLVQIVGGTWIAVLVSSAFFGAAHAFNPGATVTSSIAIALEAGVLLAAAYALTGRLWFPIGLHAAWNFAEGSLFGMSVSGTSAPGALIAGMLKGPVILTGGAFGPEASIVAVILCLSVGALLLWRTVRSGQIKPLGWARSIPGAGNVEASTPRVEARG
jgi:membrane protease YdiL (CAAX protease family)